MSRRTRADEPDEPGSDELPWATEPTDSPLSPETRCMALVAVELLSPAWARVLELYRQRVLARSGSVLTERCQYRLGALWLREHPRPERVTPSQVEAWIHRPAKIGRSGRTKPPAPATVRNRLSVIACLYRLGRREGLVDFDPTIDVVRPRATPPIPRALSREKVDQLFAAIPGKGVIRLRNRAIFVTLLLTALRCRELLSITPRSIDRGEVCGEPKVFYQVRVKGGRQVRKELPLEAWQAIEAWLAARGVSLDLLPPDRPLWGIGPSMLLYIIRRAGETAGLGRVCVHMIRHSSALGRKESGQKMSAIRDLLNHSSELQTERYCATLTGAVDDGAAAAAAYFGLRAEVKREAPPVAVPHEPVARLDNAYPSRHSERMEATAMKRSPKSGGASFSGKRLRALRERAGLTRYELAMKTGSDGVKPETIAALEMGATSDPKSSTLSTLAQILGVPMEAFLQ